jgi:hypothetical protein
VKMGIRKLKTSMRDRNGVGPHGVPTGAGL